jgi:hypothetical protein
MEAVMANATRYRYRLNEQVLETNDPVVTGRDIRAQSDLVPVSDYILIELGDRTTRSIGLEESIELSGDPMPEFLSFSGDRVFSLTINERGYEWGAEEIPVSAIRRHAAIPDDHELILDSEGDRVLEDEIRRPGTDQLCSAGGAGLPRSADRAEHGFHSEFSQRTWRQTRGHADRGRVHQGQEGNGVQCLSN